jgi:hypothetical protein
MISSYSKRVKCVGQRKLVALQILVTQGSKRFKAQAGSLKNALKKSHSLKQRKKTIGV